MEDINLLIVEDDALTAKIIYDYFNECGFNVTTSQNAIESISEIFKKDYDIVLLDLNLPDFNGLEVLKKIKKEKNIPIIVVSAHNDKKIKLHAFKYGANDYVTKPVDLEELEARIWVHLNSNHKISAKIEKNDELFKIENNLIYFNGKILDLSPKEYEIFSYLIKNKNIVISREKLADIANLPNFRSLDNHIKNIRKKLKNIEKNRNYLKTVYGSGYILKAT